MRWWAPTSAFCAHFLLTKLSGGWSLQTPNTTKRLRFTKCIPVYLTSDRTRPTCCTGRNVQLGQHFLREENNSGPDWSNWRKTIFAWIICYLYLPNICRISSKTTNIWYSWVDSNVWYSHDSQKAQRFFKILGLCHVVGRNHFLFSASMQMCHHLFFTSPLSSYLTLFNVHFHHDLGSLCTKGETFLQKNNKMCMYI